MIRIQFPDKREAARFAAAVLNVTGRKPRISRSENDSWRVQLADLTREWVLAISSLLDSGVPSHQVTLDQVASRMQAAGWGSLWPRSERPSAAPAAGMVLGSALFSAPRGPKLGDRAARA